MSKQDSDPDIADIVAGALQTSRAHAYELMRDALAAREANNPQTALAINVLVPSGHVSQEAADQAFRSACEYLFRRAAMGAPR
jgi:hypothetical protein